MKKFYLVALAIIGIYACLNFSSCTKDENEPASIIGVWNCYEIYEENPDPFTYWGDDIDYPYLVINEKFFSFSNEPFITKVGELFSYTYNEQNKTLSLLDLDNETQKPYDEEPFILQITKLTSNELWFEWDVNGYYQLFKFKKN